MANKKRACRECGFLSEADICPACGSNAFADKYKGEVQIFDSQKSIVAEKLNIEKTGNYAIKF